MNFATLKQKAIDCFSEAPFISRIHNEAEYEQALALMDELVEEYDKYLPLNGRMRRRIFQHSTEE